jgi:hypothetical protein
MKYKSLSETKKRKQYNMYIPRSKSHTKSINRSISFGGRIGRIVSWGSKMKTKINVNYITCKTMFVVGD